MDHEELVRSTTKELLNSFGEGALISRNRLIEWFAAKQLQQQMQWLIPYAEAAAIPSDEEFLQSYAAFCKDTLARCYGVSV